MFASMSSSRVVARCVLALSIFSGPALAEAGLPNVRMLMQVHDELVFEVSDGEQEVLTRIVRERMGSAADLRVPLSVQVGVGANWDQAAH